MKVYLEYSHKSNPLFMESRKRCVYSKLQLDVDKISFDKNKVTISSTNGTIVVGVEDLKKLDVLETDQQQAKSE